MIRGEWNNLRVGDLVQVHEPAFPATAATTGEVERIRIRAHGTSEVAIRLFDGERTLVWPQLTTVHRSARPSTAACWRCRALDGVAVDG